MKREALPGPKSRIAMARTATVSVWVPAMPPIEATIGISTANATTCSMVRAKIAMTAEAAIAVTRLIPSQLKRRRVVWIMSW